MPYGGVWDDILLNYIRSAKAIPRETEFGVHSKVEANRAEKHPAPRKGPVMNPTKPGSVVSNETAAETRRDTLSVTDNRTGRQFELPITNETIRALDLRPMKVHDGDFGMMSYDPAFTNTASCSSKITYIDGDKGILRYRGYSIEELAEKSTYHRNGLS